MAKKRVSKSISELTAGYEQFIKGKELNPNNGQLFDNAIKKAATEKPKQPVSKRPQT